MSISYGSTLRSERPWTPVCDDAAQLATIGHFGWPGSTIDDVLQEARIGVAKALRDWRPEGGASFRNFAVLCARRQIVTAQIAARRNKHRALNEAEPIDAPLGTSDPDVTLTLADLAFRESDDPCRIVIAREYALALMTKMTRLSPLERECVERVRLAGADYETAGRGVGGDKKTVDNALQRAESKLRLVEPDPFSDRPVPIHLRASEPQTIYVDRDAYPTRRRALREALRQADGDVVSIGEVAKRKLRHGRDVDPRGRPDVSGDLGSPVWRVHLRVAA